MNRAIFMAPPDSLILHNSKSAGGSTILVSKIKDLSDENLLLALANVVEIKEFTHDKS